MKARLLIASLLLLTACTTDEGPWVLTNEGITLELRTDPYGIRVRDASNRIVLESVDESAARRDGGDGYAPVAWTTGDIEMKPHILTKGQYLYKENLDDWREKFEVEGVVRDGNKLTVELKGGGATAKIVHELRANALRVSARLEGKRPRAWAFSFRSPESEGFLGMGERFTRTNFRGTSIYSWAEEGGIGQGEGTTGSETNPFPNGESMTYYPVPFFVSTEGYGFWLDSTWRNTFDFAKDPQDVWRVRDTGPSTAFEVFLPPAADARPWPQRIVDAFTARVGRPMLPAPWVFGPRRRVGRGSMVGPKSEIQAMREEDLAITAVDDAVHFLPKGSHVGYEDDLAAWTERAHALGYKVMGYYNSLFADLPDSPIHEYLEEGKKKGYFLKNLDGTLSTVELISGTYLPVLQVDFTNPEAVAWYQKTFDWALDLGYDGWMQDFGEYVQTHQYGANGMSGEELHNLYPVLYDKAVYDYMENGPRKGDWLAFARAGYTGSSAFAPVAWSGDPAASFEDTDGLPSMVRAVVNIGIAGVPHWGGDIGGFHCASDGGSAADGELWSRWIQQGALTPVMMDQNACVFNKDGVPKASIWTSDDAKESWRVYARLHTRLFPYIYTYSHLATATGVPIVRHLFLEHPEELNLASVDDAYYFGEAILVAPVVARGARTKKVTLPTGAYLAWPEGTVYRGPKKVTVDAPLRKLPLFLRDGYLVPMLDQSIDTLAEEDSPSIVGITDVESSYDVTAFFADATGATFTLYDGGRLGVSIHGPVVTKELGDVSTDAEFAACKATCWMGEPMNGGKVYRLRVSADGDVALGGVKLTSTVNRRIRWDLYLEQ